MGARTLALTERDWTTFKGGAEALKWNRRDVSALDAVLRLVPGRTACVQAGGHLGVYPKRLAQEFATVYTFEPAPALFPLLLANAPEPNIVRFQAALGAKAELVRLSQTRRDGKPNAHEGVTHVSGPGVIPTMRLDDLALATLDLVCLDIEGWELYALQGAAQTIARCKPVLMVEINKNLGFVGIEPDAVRGYIEGFGYRFVERHQSDEVFVPVDRMERAA